MDILLRRFTIDDWQTYKSIRLEALDKESRYYGASYAKEILMTEDDWKARLTDDGIHAFWALYDGDSCAGFTGIIQYSEDPQAVYLIASYIRKEYRRQGFSALFYQARLDWARAHSYKYAVVSHRDDNDASKAANQKFGFRYTHTEPAIFPDGSTADKVYYRLDL